MFRNLFKKAGEYSEYVSEVIAPTHRTALEQFQHNWTKVTEAIVDKSNTGAARGQNEEASVDVFSLLDDMLNALKDDAKDGNEEMGRCLEFLLEKNILRTMVSVGQGDYPKGIMSAVLRFYTSLLNDIDDIQLIPHQNVYNPMKKLLQVFSKKGCQPDVELALVKYLEALCTKLERQPYFSELFVEAGSSQFLPLVVLEYLLKSQNEDIFLKSAECLRIIMALQTDTINGVLLQNHTAAKTIVDRLVSLHAQLPPQLDNDETHQHVVEWMTNQYHGWKKFTEAKYNGLEEESLAFLAFMDFVHYCDDVLEACAPEVAKDIVAAIQKGFLEQVVAPMLIQPSEDVACTATSYVIATINQISSPLLFEGFITFLFEDSRSADDRDPNKIAICDLLIQRCDDISDELSLVTLHLFLRMLMKRDIRVVETLILRHMNGDSSQVTLPTLRSEMKAQAERIVAKIPKDLQSGDFDDSYKSYFIDAQEKIWACRRDASQWTLNVTATTRTLDTVDDGVDGEDDGPDFSQPLPDHGETGAMDSEVEAAKWTGVQCTSPFLDALIRRLRQMPIQSYSMNLLITANFATMFEFTHPSLQSILLAVGENSLTAAYVQLCNEIKSKSNRIDNVEDRLQSERSKLSLIDEDNTRDSELPAIKTLQSIILLEEFAKEIASRLLVQSNELLLES